MDMTVVGLLTFKKNYDQTHKNEFTSMHNGIDSDESKLE